jgi:hypothetical protein
VIAAPYIIDFLFFALFGILCAAIPRMPRWAWVNCFIIGVLSPLIDTAYNYRGLFTGKHNDAVYLARVHGAVVTHVLFATAVVCYIIGVTVIVMRRMKSDQRETREAPTRQMQDIVA